MSLSELAERCEKAAVGRAFDKERFAINCEIERLIFDREHGMMRSFTDSLDAAMTLVPSGHIVMVTNTDVEDEKADLTKSAAIVGPPDDTSLGYTTAATMPLALCAAALKARAASCDTHPKDGDVKQAPLVSGAVPKADAQ